MRITLLAASVLAFGISACAEQSTSPQRQEIQVAASMFTPGENGEIVHLSKDGYQLRLVAEGLEFPWGIAQLPDGSLLVTEREGRLRHIDQSGLIDGPVTGLPDDILVDGQAGLLDILLDDDFETSRKLYLSYVKEEDGKNATTVIFATLSEDKRILSDVNEIFVGQRHENIYHFGSRLDFYKDGTLLVGLGEGGIFQKEAQNLASLHGKTVRIHTDGTIPGDNPFTGISEANSAIFSFGHRNIQGLIYDVHRDIIFAHEHGPRGGDELNIIESGNNYGWPTVTYGVEYNGEVISELTEAPGVEQPAVKWVPSIAPSGMDLVKTVGFEDWRDDLLIGAMNGPEGQKLVRIDLDESGAVKGTEDLLKDLTIPFRDVISTENAIYLATANLDGAIFKLEKTNTE